MNTRSDFGGTADDVVDLLAWHLGEVDKDHDYPDTSPPGACLTVGGDAWAAYCWHGRDTGTGGPESTLGPTD